MSLKRYNLFVSGEIERTIMEIKIGNLSIHLSPEVLEILDRYIQRGLTDLESGGVILGRIAGDTIQVQRLSVPTELDKRSRMSFERHRLSAQIVINYEHANTHGQVTYLGEWHIHPEDHPTPSGTDIIMIKKQFAENTIHTDFLILLIQGRKSLWYLFNVPTEYSLGTKAATRLLCFSNTSINIFFGVLIPKYLFFRVTAQILSRCPIVEWNVSKRLHSINRNSALRAFETWDCPFTLPVFGIQRLCSTLLPVDISAISPAMVNRK
jgi:integrative and conjugative element protein (TIGR02256 family)